MILWVLVLHISALLLWCAALLYLPALIAGSAVRQLESEQKPKPIDTVERLVFTHIATPAALVAIIAGTLVFVFDRTLDGWLIAKLTLVVGLVISHVLTGLLILKAASSKSLGLSCAVLGIAQSILIVAIFWTVLAKPSIAALQ